MPRDRKKWRAVVKKMTNLWVSNSTENFMTQCGAVGFARKTLLLGVSNLVPYQKGSTCSTRGSWP